MESNVTMSLNSCGLIRFNVTNSENVNDTRDRIAVIRNIILTIVFIALFIFGVKYYMQHSKNSEYEENYEWLYNFYKHNAPEVHRYT